VFTVPQRPWLRVFTSRLVVPEPTAHAARRCSRVAREVMKRSDASAREETGDFVPQTDECEVKQEPNGGAQYEWLLDADCVGARVRKMFDGKYYGGTVTAYDEQHKWYKIKYDDGDGEELNPKELRYVLTFAPKDAEDDSGLAPEFIDLTSEDDEPDRTPEDETHSDTADVATRCPPRFRKRSCQLPRANRGRPRGARRHPGRGTGAHLRATRRAPPRALSLR